MSSDLVTGSVSAESAVTVLWRLPPALISAWVTVWLQVYVQVSVTSSLPLLFASPVGAAGEASHFGSLNVIAVRVTLPVFFTVNTKGRAYVGAVVNGAVRMLSSAIDLV